MGSKEKSDSQKVSGRDIVNPLLLDASVITLLCLGLGVFVLTLVPKMKCVGEHNVTHNVVRLIVRYIKRRIELEVAA